MVPDDDVRSDAEVIAASLSCPVEFERSRLIPQLILSATTMTNLNTKAVAITWSFDGDTGLTLLFDPTSYAFLGTISGPSAAAPEELNSYRQGIVNAVGQVP